MDTTRGMDSISGGIINDLLFWFLHSYGYSIYNVDKQL